MPIIRSQIVVDLGFGDSGKGLVVDSLCEKASSPLVVRYNGGPQAGHTVVRGDKRHVFSSFGSGTLQGVPSFFGPETLIYPPNLIREYEKLKDLNGPIPVRLYIDPRAKVITPADVALCRERERIKGHGSCGIGIGTTMARNENTPYHMAAACLLHPGLARQKMAVINTGWAAGEISRLIEDGPTVQADYNRELMTHTKDFAEACQKLSDLDDVVIMSLPDVVALEKTHMLIFEGAQGVMLDRSFGAFPNVTYADTTSKHAWSLLRESQVSAVADVVYVHRCYTTRHGNGWMPREWNSLEVQIELQNHEKETNVHNQWQGYFRRGEIDYELIKAALEFDRAHHPVSFPAHTTMIFTCLDQRPEFELPSTLGADWNLDEVKVNSTPESGHIQPS